MGASFKTPGEIIENSSNLTPGEGTIEQDGNIIAMVPGNIMIDKNSNTVSIKNNDKIPKPRIGDYLIGTVEKLGEKAATIKILQVEGDERSILPEDQYADIYVAGIVDRFLPAPVDAMRRRDIVRVKVIENSPVLKVNTRDDESCGVLSALCPQCGEFLYAEARGDYNVHCPQCDYSGYRVLSNGFGHGYELMKNGPASFNRLKQRWSKEFDEVFKAGIPARSVLIRADHRFDGRKITRPNFEGSGGNNQRNDRPRGHKLFVGGLARTVDTERLKEIFSKYGEIVDAIVMKDKETGNSRGFGFVSYSGKASAKTAIDELHKFELDGRKITVNDADDKSSNNKKEKRTTGKKIFVGGLDWGVNEKTLKELFSKHCKVIDVNIPLNKETGKSRGFGFITATEDSAHKAIKALDGFKLNGRKIGVRESENKKSPNKNNNKNARTSREMKARREEGIED
ncbi:MAG: hypothetical protein CMB64_02785 [Euryarchaeota archaeon]|nr:hypothetical protein [Euryarchaeota archaeon]